MDTTKTITKWKKKFRDPPAPAPLVKNTPPSRIHVPPLQSVFDMPPPNLSSSVEEDEEEEEKDKGETEKNPVIVEGMEPFSFGETKDAVVKLWDSITGLRSILKDGGADILTKTYEDFYNWTWTPVANILPPNTPTYIIERDTEFVLLLIILFHVLLIVVFAAYNWYYILFDKTGNSQPSWVLKKLMSFKETLPPLYFNSKLPFLMDNFFTVTMKEIKLEYIPETCKYYMLVFFLFAVCLTLYEEYKNYVATIGFPLLITLLIWFMLICAILTSKQDAWLMFAFLISSLALVITIIGIMTGIASSIFDAIGHKLVIYLIIFSFFAVWAVQFTMEHPPISIILGLFVIIVVGIVAAITYYFLPLAFLLIYGYLIGQSLFGFSRFEGKLPSYNGYAKKMLEIDVGRMTGIPLIMIKCISGIPLIISMLIFFLGVVIYVPTTFEDWKEDRCLLITWITCLISMFFCVIWGYNIKIKDFTNTL
jgi:hypothetical protein